VTANIPDRGGAAAPGRAALRGTRIALDDPATRLAIALSIAVRIEPGLIRAIRLEILPSLDVCAETDLWFSDDLVASRGPDTIMLHRTLVPQLREELAGWLTASDEADPVRELGEVTARVHAAISPTLALEERVAWLAARARLATREGEDVVPEMEAELGAALDALVRQGRAGVADWLIGAWPRLPETARRTKTAWRLRQAASLRADASRLPPEVAPSGLGLADLADLARLVEPASDVPVPVRLARGVLDIGDIGSPPGAAVVPLLDTDPRIVAVLPDDESGEGTTIAIPKGGRVSVPFGPGPARLLTPRGLVYRATSYEPELTLVPLPGSNREPLPGARPAGELDPATTIEVTLVLRRRSEIPADLIDGLDSLSGAELSARYGAAPGDVDLVRQVITDLGLVVQEVAVGSRLVRAAGTAGVLTRIFGTYLTLAQTQAPGVAGEVTSAPRPPDRVAHRYRTGGLSIPAELDGIVIAVLGLDNRPQAIPCVQETGTALPREDSSAGTDRYRPGVLFPELASACYQFPPGTDGTGQTLAFLDFGETIVPRGERYQSHRGSLSPTQMTALSRASQKVTQEDSDSLTATLVAARALAPGAEPTGYVADNTEQGFLEAICAAVHADRTPTAICIGWGAAEDSWTNQARMAIDQALADAAALGITVVVAAGDGGSASYSTDAQSRVFFPASSPHALACGGTTLEIDPETELARSEVVWPGTGGGISDVFALPPWQAGSVSLRHAQGGGSGRGVPDVAANADPATGYQLLLGTRERVFGGTAMAAVLWAALVCILAQAAGRRLGLLHPRIYADVRADQSAPGFTSITEGNNGAYRAGPGWDPCTGLGTPRGAELIRRLSGPDDSYA
jgi:kumamolisin